MGRRPFYGTGWTGQLPGGHPGQRFGPGPQQYQAPPPNYNATPQGGYYGQNQGYFGGQQTGHELQHPQNAYQGGAYRQGGENVYQPPMGPPPGKH